MINPGLHVTFLPFKNGLNEFLMFTHDVTESEKQDLTCKQGFNLKNCNVLLVSYYTVEEEHAVQRDLFVYTRFHSTTIKSNSQETGLQTYTHVFSLEVKMAKILTDLNWK